VPFSSLFRLDFSGSNVRLDVFVEVYDLAAEQITSQQLGCNGFAMASLASLSHVVNVANRVFLFLFTLLLSTFPVG